MQGHFICDIIIARNMKKKTFLKLALVRLLVHERRLSSDTVPRKLDRHLSPLRLTGAY